MICFYLLCAKKQCYKYKPRMIAQKKITKELQLVGKFAVVIKTIITAFIADVFIYILVYTKYIYM